MSLQIERAHLFTALHVKGNPLILYNIWDAGTAKALQEVGAKAIATGSWSVANAHGYSDGEKIPLPTVLNNLKEIIDQVDLPVTLDFEGGYARSLDPLQKNIEQVIATGAVGINFEDQIIGENQLYPVEEQAARIIAIRQAANIPLFINARTDVILLDLNAPVTEAKVTEVIERGLVYAAAGASGLFVPGLRDLANIRKVCQESPLPVNILMLADMPTHQQLADMGVARISYGAGPYRQMLAAFKEAARQILL
jgi:2-methylisocitrate lyase-like PEP mutase family enzyme